MNKFDQISSLGHQTSVPGGPPVNKFEQVSGIGHQISLQRRGARGGATAGLGGYLYNEVSCPGKGSLYCEAHVQRRGQDQGCPLC